MDGDSLNIKMMRNLSIILAIILLIAGAVIGFYLPKKPEKISVYDRIEEIKYIGELHLVNYSSDQMLDVYKSKAANEKAEEIEAIIRGLEQNIFDLNELLKSQTVKKKIDSINREVANFNINLEKKIVELQKHDEEERVYLAFIPCSITAFTDLENLFFDHDKKEVKLPSAKLSRPNVKLEASEKAYNMSKWLEMVNVNKDGLFQENLLSALSNLESQVETLAQNKNITIECDSLAVAYVKNLVRGIPGGREYKVSIQK